MRSLDELVNVADPAWPLLVKSIAEAAVPVNVLTGLPGAGEQCIHRLQVTARSTLGAMALMAGAILVDHGWLRLLGSGVPGLPDLASANGLDVLDDRPAPPSLLIAFDIVGGRFAVNGGGLPGDRGEVAYWGPDTLAWQPTGLGHTDFVHWSWSGNLASFAESLRWPDWIEETAALDMSQSIHCWPPQWSAEGRDAARASRRAVPTSELITFLDDLAAGLPADGPVRIKLT